MHLAVCDLNQHRLIILCRMVGEGSRGRKRRLPGTIEPCNRTLFESNEEEEDGERGGAFSAAEKRELMSRLRKLIQALPGRQGQKFDPLLIFPGLESWLSFLKLKLNEDDQVMGEDEIYRSWFKKYVSCEDSLEGNILFSKLFQNLQVRSCTEAIAETVGSIMNQHLGTNRYCFPDLCCNFVFWN